MFIESGIISNGVEDRIMTDSGIWKKSPNELDNPVLYYTNGKQLTSVYLKKEV